ncbi:16S rRNA (guanine(527)-N(7))-methyltransferase RsmG [Flavobacteriaceae bacterium]|nr:16S rRNA (guanine(527)-N(7))-methyltransferase RsmG [Flavobacteriaceae bacterium]
MVTVDIILKYFPNLTETQIDQFTKLEGLYKEWNAQINVVSRKDIDELYIRHVLHSLGIAKVQKFEAGARILDVGCGGGFPGIPLAILNPDSEFLLVDSIGKKIKVVNGVSEGIGLTNLTARHMRAEEVKGLFDFVVSRAVTAMPDFHKWIKKKASKKQNHELKNGILYLKGGDLTEELKDFPNATLFDLPNYFEEDFFETKKVVHIPLKFKPAK